MRNRARVLIWPLSAAAFTGATCLAVATAAIESENVRLRRSIQQTYDEVLALEVTLETEKIAWREATRPERLLEHWLRLDRGRE